MRYKQRSQIDLIYKKIMTIEPFVTRTTIELAAPRTIIPYAARTAFYALHKIHKLWRWIRLGNIYRNPNNFAQLAAGHGLNYLAGDSLLVRTSAICTLIASRILHAVSGYEKLVNAWTSLKDAIWNHYPQPIKCSWKPASGFFSLSTVIWIKTSIKSTILRIQLIAICIFRLFKHAALFSMRLMDATEAFTLSPLDKKEGINLLFVNSATCLSKLVDNKDFLLKSLQSHQELINKVLQSLGAAINAEQLIKTVEKTIEGAYRSTSTFNERIGEFVSACGKKWTYEFLNEIGLRHLMPDSFIPSATPPWEHPQRRSGTKRFPPREWIQRKIETGS